MTIDEVKAKVITDYESPAWKLLEEVVAELIARGVEPFGIEAFCGKHTGFEKVGDKSISVETVYRHNGTQENVSVAIEVNEIVNKSIYCGYPIITRKRLARIIVPKKASKRVINNRIEKALEYLK